MRIDLNNTAASQLANEPSAKPVSANNVRLVGASVGEDRTTLTSDSASVSSLVSCGNEFA